MKKFLKIAGLVILFAVIVAALCGVASFVFSRLAVNNYKSEISQQIMHFNENKETGEIVKLTVVPLGDLLNSEYKRANDAQSDYAELFYGLEQFYKDKAKYDKDIAAFNSLTNDDKSEARGEELEKTRERLMNKMEELNQKTEDLKKKLNS